MNKNMAKKSTPKSKRSAARGSLRDVVRLRAFYEQIAKLTRDHDVINDHACVTADKLGAALEGINPEWWKQPNAEVVRLL